MPRCGGIMPVSELRQAMGQALGQLLLAPGNVIPPRPTSLHAPKLSFQPARKVEKLTGSPRPR